MHKKVTVIGSGNVGATAAQRLAEKQLADVVLVDILEGLPQGKALDLTQAAAIEMHDCKVIGTNDYDQTANSDIVIITAGIPRKPGMGREDLLKTNVGIMKSVTEEAVKRSPNAVIIVVADPLDALCHVVHEASGFPRERVLGMSGILDAARFRSFIATELDVSIENTHAFVIGGTGDQMVPLPRYSTVAGIPVTELLTRKRIDALVHRTAQGGVEVVSYLKTRSAYYAVASAAVEMAEAILKDSRKILTCTVRLNGEYGYKGLFMGVPVKLGHGGVRDIMEIELFEDEKKAFDKSAKTVQAIVGSLEKL